MTAKAKGSGGSAKPPAKASRGKSPGQGKAPKKPGKVRAPRINVATFNKLQDAFFKDQNIEKAAKAAGVGWSTAKFYIDGAGRPNEGMAPIRKAFLDVQAEAQERKQLTLIRFHEEQAEELDEIIQVSLAELRLIKAEILVRVKEYQDSDGKKIKTGASLASALGTYERGARLMERFLGGPDQIHEHRGDDPFRDWTEDEVVEFMTTGKMPDHAR